MIERTFTVTLIQSDDGDECDLVDAEGLRRALVDVDFENVLDVHVEAQS